mmetsp:Transcript_55857/g.116863  ORF Transcript_55857/g.116863 Transcript_55857/m.116863 type:complete len:89 (+) Transcript_55857:207-473(+)
MFNLLGACVCTAVYNCVLLLYLVANDHSGCSAGQFESPLVGHQMHGQDCTASLCAVRLKRVCSSLGADTHEGVYTVHVGTDVEALHAC